MCGLLDSDLLWNESHQTNKDQLQYLVQAICHFYPFACPYERRDWTTHTHTESHKTQDKDTELPWNESGKTYNFFLRRYKRLKHQNWRWRLFLLSLLLKDSKQNDTKRNKKNSIKIKTEIVYIANIQSERGCCYWSEANKKKITTKKRTRQTNKRKDKTRKKQ